MLSFYCAGITCWAKAKGRSLCTARQHALWTFFFSSAFMHLLLDFARKLFLREVLFSWLPHTFHCFPWWSAFVLPHSFIFPDASSGHELSSSVWESPCSELFPILIRAWGTSLVQSLALWSSIENQAAKQYVEHELHPNRQEATPDSHGFFHAIVVVVVRTLSPSGAGCRGWCITYFC